MFPKILLLCSFTIASVVRGEDAYFLLNAECNSQYHCLGDAQDTSMAVVCINSRCVCDPRLGVYDRIRYHCVGKADHVCLGNTCTRNAVCDVTTNTCKCHIDYDINSEGLCLHGHEGNCEEDEDCKSGLLCYNGKCECRYPNHQYYHPENDTCYSIAQTWDATFKNNDGSSKSNQETSAWFRSFEVMLTVAQIGCLIAIIVVLAKIGMTLKEIIGSFKLHGYFLRSGMDTKIQEGASMQIESASFFDNGKV